mgnify:CR=1 FL=1
MWLNYLALLSALFVSGVAAWYSIFGLTAIFAGAYFPVLIMGSSLEFCKVVTAAWLHLNWKQLSTWLRIYLSTALLILMLITSMGIFGFLSRAHIEQESAVSKITTTDLLVKKNDLQTAKGKLSNIDKELAIFDNALSTLTNKGYASRTFDEVKNTEKPKAKLAKSRDEQIDKISKLQSEIIHVESEVKKLQAEIGPIRYVTQIFWADTSESSLEKTVTYMIVLLVVVFDPLAVVLIIGSLDSIREHRQQKNHAKLMAAQPATPIVAITPEPIPKKRKKRKKKLKKTKVKKRIRKGVKDTVSTETTKQPFPENETSPPTIPTNAPVEALQGQENAFEDVMTTETEIVDGVSSPDAPFRRGIVEIEAAKIKNM